MKDDGLSFLKQQYTDLMKFAVHQHTRSMNYWRTYLIILSIIISGLLAFLKLGSLNKCDKTLIVLIAVIGICISIIARISLNRVYQESIFTFDNLRTVENKLTEKGESLIHYFLNHEKFFQKNSFSEEYDHKFKPEFLLSFTQNNLVNISLYLFIMMFILLIIYTCR